MAQCQRIDPIIGTGEIVEYPRVKDDGSPASPPRNVESKLPNPTILEKGVTVNEDAEGEQIEKSENEEDDASITESESEEEEYPTEDGVESDLNEEKQTVENGKNSFCEISSSVEIQKKQENSTESGEIATQIEDGEEKEKQLKWRLILHQIGPIFMKFSLLSIV